MCLAMFTRRLQLSAFWAPSRTIRAKAMKRNLLQACDKTLCSQLCKDCAKMVLKFKTSTLGITLGQPKWRFEARLLERKYGYNFNVEWNPKRFVQQPSHHKIAFRAPSSGGVTWTFPDLSWRTGGHINLFLSTRHVGSKLLAVSLNLMNPLAPYAGQIHRHWKRGFQIVSLRSGIKKNARWVNKSVLLHRES